MANTIATLKQIGFLSLGMFAGGIVGTIVGTLLAFVIWGVAYLGALWSSTADAANEPLPFLGALVMTLVGGMLVGSVTGTVFAFKKSVK